MAITEKVREAKVVWLIALLAITVAAAALIPTDYTHRSLFPNEDPKFIRRIYADHTVGQTFHTRYETDHILLQMRSAHGGKKAFHTKVSNQDFITEVKLTDQDQWIPVRLPRPLAIGEHQLTFSAPEIPAQADAILIRFQVDSTNFEPGYMIVDGKESYGDVAFQLVDRIPAALQIPRYFIKHPNHTLEAFRVGVLTLLLLFVVRLLPKTKTAFRYSLLALIVFAVAIRIPTLASIDGVFGGDAFNYLSKAKAWISGNDPFNAEPRKGPFLPFLLIPTFLTRDPILWSRFLGAISAGIAAAATALALRKLHVSASLALLGGMLVAVNRELWWESLNGLANVPYAALIALSTASFSQNAPFATGLFCALTALTRYEGILVGLIYIPVLWLRNRFRWISVRRSLVPLTLLAIPFIFWPLSGALGIRTAADITSDAGLYVAWDWGDYLTNLERAKNFLLELWFYRDEPPLSWVTRLIYGTTIIGGIVLAKRRPAIGIPIILVVILQIAAVTAILPKTRYYVQIIPLLALGCIYALSLLPRWSHITLGSFLVASVWVNSWLHIPSFVEDYNYRARADSVLLQASVFLKKIDSRPAFATNFFAVETYFPLSQVVMGAPEDPEEQLLWLRDKRATHLVETTEHPWFQELLAAHPQHFQHLTSFKASYDPAQATIYEIISL
ncbi:MAG: hypothetical protein AAB538_00515 [Patescibacteria group bacterium]